MGAINYYTSNYITLGVKPYDPDDFIKDNDFISFIRDEWGIDTSNENAVYNAIQDEISEYYNSDLENITAEIKKHNFIYYHITIKPGYYEGFTLDIENNYSIAYDCYIDKKEAQKEITELKQFLIDCAGYGLVKCSPGYCPGYENYKKTIQAIKTAIKDMRQEAKITPTWSQYIRG